MKDLILFLAKSLVENPDAVQVTETEGPDSIILELNVAPEDMGKVIGASPRRFVRCSRPLRPGTASLFFLKSSKWKGAQQRLFL